MMGKGRPMNSRIPAQRVTHEEMFLREFYLPELFHLCTTKGRGYNATRLMDQIITLTSQICHEEKRPKSGWPEFKEKAPFVVKPRQKTFTARMQPDA